MPEITSLDHLVLTVADVAITCDFYQNVLGMTVEKFIPADGSERWALKFGDQKINLHQKGHEFDPKAQNPTAGSADLCFLTKTSLAKWQAHFAACDVEITDGPIARTGATGPITSLYIRDPDANLIEVSVATARENA